MNFTTIPVSDDAERIVMLEVHGVPDPEQDRYWTFSVRVDAAKLTYTYLGGGWLLEGITISGRRILSNGNLSKSQREARWFEYLGGSRWRNEETPTWVRMLGVRYADPDRPIQ